MVEFKFNMIKINKTDYKTKRTRRENKIKLVSDKLFP